MNLRTVVITRNKTFNVRTLHMILKLNILCIKNGIVNDISFVNDDVESRKNAFNIPYNRLVWIEYGVSLDNDSLITLVRPIPVPSYTSIIYPAVKEGVDWNIFKEKSIQDSSEPTYQYGMSFDTDVSECMYDMYYKVITSENPKIWLVDNDTIDDSILRGASLAYVKADVTVAYSYECFGNILISSSIQ